MIQPPMPWPACSQLPEDDLKAIYAYLRSIAPLRNQVPDYQEPTPSALEGWSIVSGNRRGAAGVRDEETRR